MKTIIEFLSGQQKGTKQEFFKTDINIGSGRNNDLIIHDIENVSPNHALLKISSESILLFNHSVQGTYINDIQISKAKIPSKGILQFGINGPKIKYLAEKAKHSEETSNITNKSTTCRRWYDRDTLMSKSMEILRVSNDNTSTKVAKQLINILNKQDPASIFVRSDIKIDQEINNLPRQTRWYDLNKFVQQIVESLKLCKPDYQEDLAMQMIMMLENPELFFIKIEPG